MQQEINTKCYKLRANKLYHAVTLRRSSIILNKEEFFMGTCQGNRILVTKDFYEAFKQKLIMYAEITVKTDTEWGYGEPILTTTARVTTWWPKPKDTEGEYDEATINII